MKLKLTRLFALLLSFLPRPLPVGMTAFDKMADRVLALAGDICTINDVRFVIATNIQRLDPNVSWASDRKFATIIRNAAAKQISGAVFMDIKQKQADAQAAAAKAAEEQAKQQLAEATAPQSAASDGEKTANV